MNISYLMRSTTLITFFLYMQILLLKKIYFFLDDVIYHSISPMIPLYCALQYTTISLKNLYVYFAGGANMRIIPRKKKKYLKFHQNFLWIHILHTYVVTVSTLPLSIFFSLAQCIIKKCNRIFTLKTTFFSLYLLFKKKLSRPPSFQNCF